MVGMTINALNSDKKRAHNVIAKNSSHAELVQNDS